MFYRNGVDEAIFKRLSEARKPTDVKGAFCKLCGGHVLLRPGCRGDFSVKCFSWKTWNITQDLSSWSAQASLSQHSLAWHDFDPAFRSFGPSPPEWLLSPSAPLQLPSPRRLWPGQDGLSPEPLPRRSRKHGEFFGDFLGEILALPSKCFGTPKKSRAKIRATSVQTILASNPCRNPHKKWAKKRAKNPCKKSVQKIGAKSPCRKSVQKIRAKNLCKTNPCKRLPQSNIAKWETPNFIVIFVRVVLLQVVFGNMWVNILHEVCPPNFPRLTMGSLINHEKPKTL